MLRRWLPTALGVAVTTVLAVAPAMPLDARLPLLALFGLATAIGEHRAHSIERELAAVRDAPITPRLEAEHGRLALLKIAPHLSEEEIARVLQQEAER